MYEDPNVSDRTVTVTFTFASDDKHDAEMREEIHGDIEDIAQRQGCDYEIHEEDMPEVRRLEEAVRLRDALARGARANANAGLNAALQGSVPRDITD